MRDFGQAYDSLRVKSCCYRSCNINGRFTSVSGHKGRRSWMMRALRILDSPYAPTLGILRDFQDNLLPVRAARAGTKPGLWSKREQSVAETCDAGLNRRVYKAISQAFSMAYRP